MNQHPLFLGPNSTRLRGAWVKHKTTECIGYVAHVERRRNPDERPLLWIVYPPGRQGRSWKPKFHVAGSAYADEVKKLNWPRKELT